MSASENKAIYRRFVDEILNGRDLAAVPRYTPSDFIDNRHRETSGIEGTQKFLAAVFAAFPDIHFVAEDMIAEEDRVVVRFSIRGTHKGEFLGIAPTGKQVTWSGINIGRFVDGKIAELWGESDQLGLIRQLTGRDHG
ncbi:MAG: ester cyclase [Candidatus Binataceae bacterium]